MVADRFLANALAGILLLSASGCDDGAQSQDTPPVSIQLQPGPNLDISKWNRTDSVRFVVTSVQKAEILDTTVRFKERSVPPISHPRDIGITLNAGGTDSDGILIWTASYFLPGFSGSGTPQTQVILVASPLPRVERTMTAQTPTLAITSENGTDSVCLQLSSSTASTSIHCTLDGTNPTFYSPSCEKRICERLPIHLRAISLGDSVYPSLVLDTIVRNR